MTITQDLKHMESSLQEIKEVLADIHKRIQTIELKEAGCSPLINAKIDAAFRKLDDHDSRLKSVETTQTSQKNTLTIISWVGMSITGIIISYIIGRILNLL